MAKENRLHQLRQKIPIIHPNTPLSPDPGTFDQVYSNLMCLVSGRPFLAGNPINTCIAIDHKQTFSRVGCCFIYNAGFPERNGNHMCRLVGGFPTLLLADYLQALRRR